MASEHPPLTIRDNPAAHRYETEVDGELAVAYYQLAGTTITFTHTEVPERFEGRGIGGALARFALEDARARGLGVIPRCPFISAYIRRHPEYQPLVLDYKGEA
jgi:predicted GNAT family acetyltransferase